jgi:lipopolysaccharide/colanic/teichoic acid biosynthesis glycosyltransferase/glycogen synthase
MKLIYVIDYRFARTPDGTIWTDTAYDEAFWEPYLQVFDQVTLVSRVREVVDRDPAWLRVNSDRVSVAPLPHYLGPLEFFKKSVEIRASMRKILGQPGTVILRVPSQLSIVAAAELRKIRKPYGVEVVGDASAAFAPGVVKVKGRALLRQWFSRSQRNICRQAMAAAYVAECLHRRYPGAKQAETLVCSDVRLDQEWIRSSPHTYERPGRHLITVATLSQTYKGIDVLLQAIAECRSRGMALTLTIVGHGKYQQSLTDLAVQLGIDNCVRFLGCLPWGPDLRQQLDSADLFVLPSRVEALPRALLEAMARALPAIATNVGAVSELLPPDQMVAAGDARELANQIMHVSSSPGRLTEMSRKSLETARQYGWSLLRERWHNFHSELARRTAHPGKRSSARPRVVLITTSAPALWIFFRDQAKFLVEQGFDVYAVCAPGRELKHFEQYSGCTVVPLKMERSIVPHRDALATVRLVRLLRRLCPDILHTHTPKAGILGTMAGFLAGCPVRVHTYHGLRSQTLSGFKGTIVEAAERWSGKFATHCLAVSPSLRNELVQRRICLPGKLQVHGNGGCSGIDLRQFEPASHREAGKAFRRSLGIPEDALVVSYVGRIAKDKGVAVLADAWKSLGGKHPNARLLICGPLDETDSLPYDVLRSIGSDASICFKPGLHDDIAQVLAASDISVLPSFREGLGVTALEASAMQLPVIASNVTGLVDAVVNGVTGILVTPRDPVDLANAIQILSSSSALRLRMGWAGREFVVANFDRNRIFHLLEAAYRKAIEVPSPARQGSNAKRMVDLLLAVPALLAAAPVIAFAALGIKLLMGGPVLFRQQRAGLHGIPFAVFKLRTMTDERDTNGELLRDEQRLPAFGRFLRATSIDELPQLWNVVRGEMSLVGPRPLLERYLSRYSESQMRRHLVRPGLTGWAQIQGRNALTWEEKFSLDVWYVDHQSFALDCRILLKTIPKLFIRQDVSAPGHCSMPEFLGTSACSTDAAVTL